jgi:hypothetical protein
MPPESRRLTRNATIARSPACRLVLVATRSLGPTVTGPDRTGDVLSSLGAQPF